MLIQLNKLRLIALADCLNNQLALTQYDLFELHHVKGAFMAELPFRLLIYDIII